MAFLTDRLSSPLTPRERQFLEDLLRDHAEAAARVWTRLYGNRAAERRAINSPW